MLKKLYSRNNWYKKGPNYDSVRTAKGPQTMILTHFCEAAQYIQSSLVDFIPADAPNVTYGEITTHTFNHNVGRAR